MANQVSYSLDPKASQLIVHAFATGLVAVTAHNPKFAIRDFSGEAKFVPGTFSDALLQVKMKASSLEIMDEVSAQDRREIERVMFQEVLETRAFPEINYESTQITTSKVSENLFGAKVMGKLTLHGVTRPQGFSGQIVAGEDTLRAYGDFTVKQTDFAMHIASIAGGTLKMKDDLRISFFVIGRK